MSKWPEPLETSDDGHGKHSCTMDITVRGDRSMKVDANLCQLLFAVRKLS